jgi:cytochrome oxidase Cu insertion factor (SCO1/SenC/PrrC family)
MSRVSRCGIAVALLAALAAPAVAQRETKDEDFLKEKPVVGDPLPDLTVYTPDGKEFKTADLRGHYTVLTFGCLT